MKALSLSISVIWKGSTSLAAGDAAGLVHFAYEYVGGTGRKNGAGDGTDYGAAGAAADGRQK
jgi:hypothetical protein